MLRIAVLLSGRGSNLQALIDAASDPGFPAELVRVISNVPDAGGLDVSIDAEVLDESGRPIAGLYAAGACASNIAQDGTGYSSGTCIGESTFFGRRAGRAAAAG